MLREMTAAEFDLWAAYYRDHGFDADRAEWAAANAGAAAAQAAGARVSAARLVPKFGTRASDPRRMLAWLDSLGPEKFFPIPTDDTASNGTR